MDKEKVRKKERDGQTEKQNRIEKKRKKGMDKEKK
jgi:hypothetical protein